jgi:two-component system, chemotaxis family, chemotaxis protein CheY
MRLLIVEDSELIRKVTRLAFRGGHELHEAANGIEGLAQLRSASEPFDAIVLDLQMPDMNGVEFLRTMRQNPACCLIPVIVATSEGETSPLLQEVRKLGVAAILKKPWKPHELASAVDEAIQARDKPRGNP